MLKIAFHHRLTFTVGTSASTGTPDCVIWNTISHKTRAMSTYPTYPFCYPDPAYLDTVTRELALLGITESDINFNVNNSDNGSIGRTFNELRTAVSLISSHLTSVISNVDPAASNTGYVASNIGPAASNSGCGASNIGPAASNSGYGASNIGPAASNSGYGTSKIGPVASNIGADASHICSATSSYIGNRNNTLTSNGFYPQNGNLL